MKNRSYKKIIAVILTVSLIFTCVPAEFWKIAYAKEANEDSFITNVSDTNTGNMEREESALKETEVSKNLADYKIVFDQKSFPYTGQPIEPKFKVVNDKDPANVVVVPEYAYDVLYENNINKGMGKVTVRAREYAGYTGSISAEFPIGITNISNASVTLSGTLFRYTGGERKPTVTVSVGGHKLIQGKDYTLHFANCIKPGVATVTVKGIGNFYGSVSKQYRISVSYAKMTTLKQVNHEAVEIGWKKLSNVDGYLIYKSTSPNGGFKCVRNASPKYLKWIDKKLSVAKTYYYKMRSYKLVDGKYYYSPYTKVVEKKIKLLKPSKVKAVTKTYTSAKVYWTRVAEASGYMVYRRAYTEKHYTKVATVKGYKTTSYTQGRLKTGQKYYYKIVAYKYSASNPGYISMTASVIPHVGTVSYDKSRIKRYRTATLLAWHKVAGATGYEIYKYSPTKKRYVYVKNPSYKTTSWYDSKVRATGKYYYKIRAYRLVDGKRKYGPMSKTYVSIPTGWIYTDNYKVYYDKNGNLVKDLRRIIGPQSSYVIKVNKQRNVVTVYAKDGNNGYIIPVVSFVCSAGHPTPVGTFYTPAKYRWLRLIGPSWGQWCTGIKGDFLFHSVYYMKENNNKTLPVATYNRLGNTESHGCVRLRAGDAKWLYDNCRVGTKVIIYNSSYAGPYGKPSFAKLPYWHTWDPTDPTAYKYCRAYHCHGR